MMRRKAWVVILCLAALTVLAIAASPAAAGAGGEPQVATPGVAYVHLQDGEWWSGGYGWGGYTLYGAGTPIPAQDFISEWDGFELPDKSLAEQFPQIILLSMTIKAANGDVVVQTTEEQSAKYWGKVTRDPFLAVWGRHWLVPVGYLLPGTYQVAYLVHLTTTLEFTDPATGELIIIKPFKKTLKTSFTVQ